MMPSGLSPFDIKIVQGTTTIEARLAKDESGSPMWRRNTAPSLMDVASTQLDVTYSQIPRSQGAEVAFEGVGNGAGAYYYQAGKYAFGESVATEGGIVYPGPEALVTTVAPSGEAGKTINEITAAAAAVVRTTTNHGMKTGNRVTITGTDSTPNINGTHTITRIDATHFSVPVTTTIAGGAGAAVVTGLTGLDGVIAAFTRWQGVDYIAAGQHVYKWDAANTQWLRIHTVPGTDTYVPASLAAAATFREPPATITDITWFRNAAGADVLLIAFGGTTYPYAIWTGGATWTFATNQTDNTYALTPWYYPKLWGKRERGVTKVQLIGAVDPDVIYATGDLSTWDTGTRVGEAGGATSQVLFTSISAAPVTGELLVGKQDGLRTFDSTDNTIMAFGPIAESNGEGMSNFAQPTILGGRSYFVVSDYDAIEYNAGVITPGFGVARAGPRIPEMQKGIVATTSDGLNQLYAALNGSEGYVMRGQYQDDSAWHWHGAYIKLGQAIGRMWISAHSADPNTGLYLKMAPTAAPYLPYRALIPRVDLQTASASQAKFNLLGKIRFGYVTAGLANQIKVLGHSTVNGINLDSNNYWRLDYRKDGDVAYTAGSQFTTTGQKQYYPHDLAGVRFEIQANYVGAANTSKPAIESVVNRIYRRPVRLNTFELTILAESGMTNNSGGQDLLGSGALYTALDNVRNGYAIPLLTDLNYDAPGGKTWAVDIVSVTETWVQNSAGPGRSRAFIVQCQELDTIDNPRQQTAYAG